MTGHAATEDHRAFAVVMPERLASSIFVQELTSETRVQ
jgi:hypothetical protein